MNPFYGQFPKEIRVGKQSFPIRTDFRAVLRLMDEIGQAETASDKLSAILSLYKRVPADTEAAVYAAADFVSGDKSRRRNMREDREQKQTVSYSLDAPFIAADFLRFYGIDLTSCRYLHWWKFLLLFEGLSEESETKKRMGYRSINTGKIRNREERERIQRIQRAIAIENQEADAERIGELFGNLM